jgi:hypothetical protein
MPTTAKNDSSDIDWDKLQQIERDICYAYHQIAPYGYIMGDLYWGSLFSLPYWNYLQVDGLEDERAKFMCDGCLVLILAMAFAALDSSDNYIVPFVPACRNAVEKLKGSDSWSETHTKLMSVVETALNSVERGDESNEKLEAQSRWVHSEFVMGYFRRMARIF